MALSRDCSPAPVEGSARLSSSVLLSYSEGMKRSCPGCGPPAQVPPAQGQAEPQSWTFSILQPPAPSSFWPPLCLNLGCFLSPSLTSGRSPSPEVLSSSEDGSRRLMDLITPRRLIRGRDPGSSFGAAWLSSNPTTFSSPLPPGSG